MDETTFLNTLQHLAAAGASDQRLLRIGRDCNCDLLWMADARGAYLHIRQGRIVELIAAPRHLRSYDFALRAPASAWAEFWSRLPRPGFHDVFALARFGHATIDGCLDKFVTHLPYFKRLLALPREFAR